MMGKTKLVIDSAVFNSTKVAALNSYKYLY